MRHIIIFDKFLIEDVKYSGLIKLDDYVNIFFEILEDEHCSVTIKRRVLLLGDIESINTEEYEITSSSYKLLDTTNRIIDGKKKDTSNLAIDIITIDYGNEAPDDTIKHNLVKRAKGKIELEFTGHTMITHSRQDSTICVIYQKGAANIT